MQYKIGDEVVLRPETKPYTFREDYSDEIKIKELDSYVYDDFSNWRWYRFYSWYEVGEMYD